MAIQKIGAQPSFRGVPDGGTSFIRKAAADPHYIKPEGIVQEGKGLLAKIKSALRSLPDEGGRR